MPVDGAHAQVELTRDLTVGPAGGDELHHLELSLREISDARLVVARGCHPSNGAPELAQLPGCFVGVANRSASRQPSMGIAQLGDRALPVGARECPAGENPRPRRLDRSTGLVGGDRCSERELGGLLGLAPLEQHRRAGSPSLGERHTEAAPLRSLHRAAGELFGAVNVTEHQPGATEQLMELAS